MAEKTAVPLLIRDDDGRLHLDVAAMEGLVAHVDEPVVVISVAGAFRKGKSFLLDYMIRFLDCGNLGEEDAPLKGFSWRGGAERDTTGLLAWPVLFPTILPTGERVVIMLLDSQGAFDSQSTMRQAATVFALSTLISSVQIFNLTNNIQEDDLHHLQLFTEYGKLAAMSSSKGTPFQKLVFLVRDWPYAYELPYGEMGGKTLLDRRLRITTQQHPELQFIRKHITTSFKDLTCFLMPHPGKVVATEPTYDGRLSKLDSDFRQCLLQFLQINLSPSKLVVKNVAGQQVKARELTYYLKSYLTAFSGDVLPRPTTIVAATAEANNLAAGTQAKDDYCTLMKNVCGSNKPYINATRLEHEHLTIKDKVILSFDDKPKMGGKEFSEPYRKQLEISLEDLFHHFRSSNDSKNVYRALLTPILLIMFTISFYVLSGLFGIIGFYSISNLLNISMGLSLLSVITWSYVRYTGDMTMVGQIIDCVVLALWESVIKPIYRSSVEESVLRATLLATEHATEENIIKKIN